MDLLLKRDVFGDTFTLGVFYKDGKKFGYTCEDKDRGVEDDKDGDGNSVDPGEKVYGKTAIPRGRYQVVLSHSHKFRKTLPEVLSVPGFTGIRIHGGNTDEDSLGCPLLGAHRDEKAGRIWNCAPTLNRLMEAIQQAEDIGEPTWLTIE